MKKQLLWEDHRALATACLLASVLAVPQTAFGSASCLSGTPARPVEETLNVMGTDYNMWPESLCPADPNTDLACIDPVVNYPADRDSTEYGGSQTPARGLEFFYDFDIVDNDTVSPSETHLFMAYNSGWQIWDIGGANAKNPQLLSSKDGFFREFFEFEGVFTHNWQIIWDIAALVSADAQAAPGEVLVALGGEDPVGLSIWNATSKKEPVQLYQDPTRFGLQVAAMVIGGRSYAFFATSNGVHVYDMTRAREVGPCNERLTNCGGGNPVYRGVLEQDDCAPGTPEVNRCAKYLAVLKTEVPTVLGPETRHYIVFSDANIGTPNGVEIRQITDPATAASTQVLSGLGLSATAGLVFSNELFEYAGRYYVAVVNVDDLEIYDITPCITVGPSDPGCGFGNRRISFATGLAQTNFMKYSENFGKPYLYKGSQSICSQPPGFSEPDIEYLLDLSDIAAAVPEEQRAKRILGDEYPDPANGRRINYWTSHYDRTTDGYSAFAPIVGEFHEGYFYQTGQTVFSVHFFRGDLPPSVQISATSSDRWQSTSEPPQDEWVQLTLACLPTGTDSNWLWSTPTPNAILDDNDIPNPRVQAPLCASDSYPTAACADQTVQVDLTADCDSSPLVATPLMLTLADPRPFVSAIEIDEGASGTPPYTVCEQVSFAASGALSGNSAGRTFEWRIAPLGAGGVERTCPGDPALSCTETTLTWSTTSLDLGLIFADGFESGDTSVWDSTHLKGVMSGTHQVTLSLSNPYVPAAEPFERTTEITLSPLSALSLAPGIFTVSGPDAAGSYDFTALADGATAYHWEFEQAPGLAGNDPSCAVDDTVPCCRLMTHCQVVEETTGQVTYLWPPIGNSSGLHEIGLEVTNCDPGGTALSGKRDVDVEVSDAVAPEIDAFNLVEDPPNCGCTGFFGPECHCNLVGATVTANVTLDVTGACSDLQIDWGDGHVDSGLSCSEPSYSHAYDTLGSYDLEATACLGSLCDTQFRFTSFPVPLDIE